MLHRTLFCAITILLAMTDLGMSSFITKSTGVSLAALARDSQRPKMRIHALAQRLVPEGVLKLVNVSDLESPSFPVDLAIEVRNTSNKPIYFLSAVMVMPESRPLFDGKPLGLLLT